MMMIPDKINFYISDKTENTNITRPIVLEIREFIFKHF